MTPVEPITNKIALRRARPSDVSVLVDFNRAMALETEGKELAGETLCPGVAALFDQPEYGFYVIAETLDGQVTGSLMITYEWSDWRNGLFWWIQSVYVAPEWRRRGVYRAMYEFVKEIAAAEKVCGFRLYVERNNRGAQDTYVNLGMSETHYLMFESLANGTTTKE